VERILGAALYAVFRIMGPGFIGNLVPGGIFYGFKGKKGVRRYAPFADRNGLNAAIRRLNVIIKTLEGRIKLNI
jgi:hypothetical protein